MSDDEGEVFVTAISPKAHAIWPLEFTVFRLLHDYAKARGYLPPEEDTVSRFLSFLRTETELRVCEDYFNEYGDTDLATFRRWLEQRLALTKELWGKN